MNRDVRLDLMRFAAIVLVTLFHVWRFIGSPSERFGPFDLAAPLEKGAMGVTIFVFVSGYLCRKSADAESASDFLWRKLTRIVPVYYVALLIWNVLIYLGITEKSHSLWDNIAHMLFVHNLGESTFYSVSGVFWYLGLQVQLYLIFALMRNVIFSFPLLAVAVSFLLTIIANTILSHPFPVLDRGVLSYGFPFVLGIVAATRSSDLLPAFRAWPVFLSLSALTVIVSLLPSIVPWGRLDFIVNGLLVCLACVSLPEGGHLKMIAILCGRLALASYSIYLYNYIFYSFDPTLSGAHGLVVYTAITLGFGAGAYFLIEKPIGEAVGRWTQFGKRCQG